MIRHPSKTRRHHESHRIGAVGLTGLGIGGIIGAGYLLGSGISIRQAGPAVVITYLLGGVVMAEVMGALTTLATHVPQTTSYREYIARYLGGYAGFFLGWVIFASGILGLGSEAVAAGVFAHYWLPGIPVAILATLIVALVLLINLGSIGWLGLVESILSLIKVIVIAAFIGLVLVVLMIGWPVQHVFTAHPLLPFAPHGWIGVFNAGLVVIFSYSGVTAVAMATARAKNPKTTVPQAAWGTVLGVTALYTLGIWALLQIVGWQQVSTTVSPFVLALHQWHIPTGTGILTAVLLVASFTVMVGSFYATLWVLVSLAEAHEVPSWFCAPKQSGKTVPSRLRLWLWSSAAVYVSLSTAYLLPQSAYTDLTAASSFFSLANWVLILGAFLRWTQSDGKHRSVSSLVFGGRVGALVTLALLVVLTIQSIRLPALRPGFWAFLGIWGVVTLGFLVTRRQRTVKTR